MPRSLLAAALLALAAGGNAAPAAVPTVPFPYTGGPDALMFGVLHNEDPRRAHLMQWDPHGITVQRLLEDGIKRVATRKRGRAASAEREERKHGKKTNYEIKNENPNLKKCTTTRRFNQLWYRGWLMQQGGTHTRFSNSQPLFSS